MHLTKYKTPPLVEELVFQINPGMVDKYLDEDYACFTQGLAAYPGFMGSEIWVSLDCPGYVRNIIFWKDRASLEAVDPNWVAAMDAQLNALMGEGNIHLVEVSHSVNQMSLAQEYR